MIETEMKRKYRCRFRNLKIKRIWLLFLSSVHVANDLTRSWTLPPGVHTPVKPSAWSRGLSKHHVKRVAALDLTKAATPLLLAGYEGRTWLRLCIPR